jgi:hypothetical protein
MDGRIFRVNQSRALVLDIARLARYVPSFPVERWFDLGEVAEARSQTSTRISWVTLFLKAYGIASQQLPLLRTHYSRFPFPYFYQSPSCTISLSINRQHAGSDHLFWGRFFNPESQSLIELQRQLDRYCHEPVEQIFKRQLFSSRFPALLRRLAWWWRLDLQPRQRGRRLGTGSISVLAGQGVYNRQHPSILTSSLSYGPMEPDGRVWVTLQCDHRVMDGVAAAEAINQIHQVITTEILSELRTLESAKGQVISFSDAQRKRAA